MSKEEPWTHEWKNNIGLLACKVCTQTNLSITSDEVRYVEQSVYDALLASYIASHSSQGKPWTWAVNLLWWAYPSAVCYRVLVKKMTGFQGERWTWWKFFYYIPECVARVPVSLWGSGGWGCVRSTLRSRSQPSATVRNRPRDPRMAVPMGSSAGGSFLEVSDVSLLRFAWQAWHFVTFRRVLQRVENRFAWQAQYFCDVFRRCVAVFVAGAALWTCPSSFFVAGAAL